MGNPPNAKVITLLLSCCVIPALIHPMTHVPQKYRTHKPYNLNPTAGTPRRRGWDSNPCDVSVKRFSRPPRYDRFDTSPNQSRKRNNTSCDFIILPQLLLFVKHFFIVFMCFHYFTKNQIPTNSLDWSERHQWQSSRAFAPSDIGGEF